METVEVIIKIPEYMFEDIQDRYRHPNKGDGINLLEDAVVKGTVLPKGHGKIIDSKQFFIALNKYLEERKSFSYADLETVINCCTPPIVKENTYGDS